MARVTIEDCIDKVEDRFELVALAAQRARNISSGSDVTIERKGEKDTVIALREIAEETINVSDLREDLTKNHQKERNTLEDFIAPANNNSDDSIEIDEEDADIAAAIATASQDSEEDEVEAEFAEGIPSGIPDLGDDEIVEVSLDTLEEDE